MSHTLHSWYCLSHWSLLSFVSRYFICKQSNMFPLDAKYSCSNVNLFTLAASFVSFSSTTECFAFAHSSQCCEELNRLNRFSSKQLKIRLLMNLTWGRAAVDLFSHCGGSSKKTQELHTFCFLAFWRQVLLCSSYYLLSWLLAQSSSVPKSSPTCPMQWLHQRKWNITELAEFTCTHKQYH